MTLAVSRHYKDPLLVGGFLSALLLGLLNPFYVSLILAKLPIQVLSIGSFLLSCLPFLVVLFLEADKWRKKLFLLLPYLLLAEGVLTVAAAFLAFSSLTSYYLVNTALFGLMNTLILCLMQRVKARRYRGLARAAFERRYLAADALGYGIGSALVMSGLVGNLPLWAVATAAVAQIATLEVTFLVTYQHNL